MYGQIHIYCFLQHPMERSETFPGVSNSLGPLCHAENFKPFYILRFAPVHCPLYFGQHILIESHYKNVFSIL